MKEKAWFISGCSTGFGRALATHVLKTGYKVILSARKLEDVQDLVSKYPETAKSVQLDLEDQASIQNCIEQAPKLFGRIDVLVNNAGIGYFSSAEEADMIIARKMFEVNFFGLTELTAGLLPMMRQQKSGHVFNVSSIGGLVGFPGVSFYNATKFAVNGYSEALAKEVTHLNMHVTVICPSGFRTDWAGRSAFETPVELEDYKETAATNMAAIRSRSGNQPGDPDKAAEAIVAAYQSEEPPLYLLLGNGAYNGATQKLIDLKKDFDAWADTSKGADVPLASA
jgi:NADP-dependent 3-hydroxy acid dehydrogenase YdfG